MLRKNGWSGSLAYNFIVSEPKGEVFNSKIDQMAAISTSSLKWAGQAQFLSPTHQILEINQFFEAVKMVLTYLVKTLLFSDIKKMATSSPSIYRDLHELVFKSGL